MVAKSLSRSAPAAALAAFLVIAFAVIAASCTQALGLTGQRDVSAELCPFISKCYGDLLPECDNHLDDVVGGFQGEALEGWLRQSDTGGCLDSCSKLRLCIDYKDACPANSLGQTCTIDENCCGFTSGLIACQDEKCCRPLGADCTVSSDCCPNAGFCINHTCGGVVCAKAGENCLNDFQCCAGICNAASRCEVLPCPPLGFACEEDSDCCKNLVCDPTSKRCTDPPCSLEGESCLTAANCCDPTHVCNTQGGMGGVCSPSECNPDNSDCFNDDQCCSGHCIGAPYRLCGECVETNQPCSAAVPCCAGSAACVGGFCN